MFCLEQKYLESLKWRQMAYIEPTKTIIGRENLDRMFCWCQQRSDYAACFHWHNTPCAVFLLRGKHANPSHTTKFPKVWPERCTKPPELGPESKPDACPQDQKLLMQNTFSFRKVNTVLKWMDCRNNVSICVVLARQSGSSRRNIKTGQANVTGVRLLSFGSVTRWWLLEVRFPVCARRRWFLTGSISANITGRS